MTWKKNFVIPILLAGMMFLGIFGCGSDDEKTDNDKSSEEKPVSQPILLKEDLLGTWEVVSINGLTSEAFLESPEGEDLEGQKVEVKQFHFVFLADDSWTINLEFEAISDFPDNPPDPGLVLPDGKLDITGVWSGTYNIDTVLTFLTQKVDVNLTSDPEDFIEKVTEGHITKEEAEQDYIRQFRDIILTPFKQSTGALKGNTLTLITSAAKKMVLEKQ